MITQRVTRGLKTEGPLQQQLCHNLTHDCLAFPQSDFHNFFAFPRNFLLLHNPRPIAVCRESPNQNSCQWKLDISISSWYSGNLSLTCKLINGSNILKSDVPCPGTMLGCNTGGRRKSRERCFPSETSGGPAASYRSQGQPRILKSFIVLMEQMFKSLGPKYVTSKVPQVVPRNIDINKPHFHWKGFLKFGDNDRRVEERWRSLSESSCGCQRLRK